MITGEFTYRDAMMLFGMLCAGASALLGVWWRIEVRIRQVERDAGHNIRNAQAESLARDALTDKEIANYKLYVSEKYASREAVREMEKRLEDRLEAISDQVQGMPEMIVERITKFLQLPQRGRG